MKRIHHVGISIRDMDRSIRFYRDNFDMELVIEREYSGEKFDKVAGMSGAEAKMAMLRLGDTLIELFEFKKPLGRAVRQYLWPCDYGITHIAFEVEDIWKKYEELVAMGVDFNCPPQDVREGVRATYMKDPDGNMLELVEYS
jgi:catechol 2,3-dioxygenase-like lactoylglutathione lyase family enzyme